MVEHFFGVCPSFWSWKLPSFLILGSKCVEYFVPVLVWGIITTCLQWSGLPGQGECDGKLDNLRNFQQSFLVHSWWSEKIFAKLFKVEWCPKQGKTCLILSRVFSWSTSVSDHQVTHIQCSVVTYFTPFSPPKAVLMTNKPNVVVCKLAETFSTIWRGRPLACKSLNYYGDQRKRGSKKLLKSLDESLVI